ncbi:hypothetical protein [Minwuia thermotolerans]|uniref:hypothetical protein n=1 Tax=Minwuia thermotolerans TaxID=2056226 RepID=UPI000F62CF60|nr:hypothetical protein [Minwuia thermotolerans]
MEAKHLAIVARLAAEAVALAVTVNDATARWRAANRLVERLRAENRPPTEAELQVFRDRIAERGAAIDALDLGGEGDGQGSGPEG